MVRIGPKAATLGGHMPPTEIARIASCAKNGESSPSDRADKQPLAGAHGHDVLATKASPE